MKPAVSKFLLCMTSAVALTAMPIYALAQSIDEVGTLPTGTPESEAYAISANGLFIVGKGYATAGTESFKWDTGDGIVGLGDLPGGAYGGLANAVNQDGSVIVGYSHSVTGTQAYRWTAGGGLLGLGYIPGGGGFSSAKAVSYDGSVIAGEGLGPTGDEAFRWTSLTGIVGLGFIPGGGLQSSAYGISGDGRVIVGRASGPTGDEAFRWEDGDGVGLTGIGYLPGGNYYSEAVAANYDGSVIVGYSLNGSLDQEAYRWTAGVGMVGLGDLAGGNYLSHAAAINADGSVIVGYSNSAAGDEAFRWTDETGMVSLKSILDDLGVDTSPWNLEQATGVSADGNVVVGYGDYNGTTRGYIANLARAALSTPENIAESLQTVAVSARHVTATSARYLNQALFVAQHMLISAVRPNTELARAPHEVEPAAGPSSPYANRDRPGVSLFVIGSYSGDFDESGNNQLNGIAGLGAQITDDIIFGAGIIAGDSRSVLDLRGHSELDSKGLLLFSSYKPESYGLRIYGTAYAADLSLDITRGYINGGSYDFSRGETDGFSYGAALKAGWVTTFGNYGTTIMPYGEIRYSRTTIDGYMERDGGFATRFSDQDNNASAALIGLEMEHPFTSALQGRIGIAGGHTLSAKGDTLTTDTGGLVQNLSFNSDKENWAEVSAGASWQAAPAVNFTIELRGRAGNTPQPDGTVLLGTSIGF